MRKFIYLIKNHLELIVCLLCLTLFALFVGLYFYADERYYDDIEKGFTIITKCGESSSISSFVEVANQPDMAEICDETVIRMGKPGDNRLSITCNVDWGEEVIPDLLDILKKNDTKITFFVTGKWAEKNPPLLKEMYINGHEIQSHGYCHKLCSQISESDVTSEIQKTEKIIKKIIGIKPTIFAPPSGDFDERTVDICNKLGYKMSLWSADTIDWREDSTADIIYKRIMKKELHGAIILMHPKPETIKVLPDLLAEFKKEKLTPVTLSELIK